LPAAYSPEGDVASNQDNDNEREREKTMTKYGSSSYYKRFPAPKRSSAREAASSALSRLRQLALTGERIDEWCWRLENRTYPAPLN
jgi:hypothetical protein